MKKLTTFILTLILSVLCLTTLTACEENKYVGTYEMVSISGYMTIDGQTTTLSEDLYDYYRIILEKDGSAKVQSKGVGNASYIDADAEWEFEDGKIKLITDNYGIKVTEEMEWEDGTITYNASQSGQGFDIQMIIVLEKQ